MSRGALDLISSLPAELPAQKQRHGARAVALGGEGTATSSGAVEVKRGRRREWQSSTWRKQIVAWGCPRTRVGLPPHSSRVMASGRCSGGGGDWSYRAVLGCLGGEGDDDACDDAPDEVRVQGPTTTAIAPRDGRPRLRDLNPPVNVSRFEQSLWTA